MRCARGNNNALSRMNLARNTVDRDFARSLKHVDHGVTTCSMARHALIGINHEERDFCRRGLRKREAVNAARLDLDLAREIETVSLSMFLMSSMAKVLS